MATMSIPGRRGPLDVWISAPETGSPWPGVVVIHDAFGMTRDLRRQAEWLAENGYLAVAPDLFAKRNKAACMVSVMRQANRREGPAFEDIESTRAWLAGREDCTGRIGVIGFCMGGGLALLSAPERGFLVSSVNYGTASKRAYGAEFLAKACPIVGSYGARDRTLKGAADRLERALTAAGVAHDVKEYAEAGHGFLNDHEGSGEKLPLFFAVTGKLMPGAGYNEAAARDARRRILEFFEVHLRSPQP